MKAPNEIQIKDMPARNRVLLLRLNTRRVAEEGKRLQGAVSEAKTAFLNTLKAPVPDSGAEAKATLQRLQLLHEEEKNAKDKKAGFKQRARDTQHALLFSEMNEGGQMVLPGAELELAPEQLRELKLAVADVKTQDRAAKDDPESEAKYPAENTHDLDELEAMLDVFVATSGISAASLGSTPEAPAPAPKTGRGKANLSAVAATH
jgi:hypothetical protein